jgi:hypothetical protein
MNNNKTMSYTFQPPEKITSDEGHVATVTLVNEGRHEGKWRLEIERPGQAPKIYHTAPNYGAVQMKFAKYFNLPLSSTMLYIGGKNEYTSSTNESDEELLKDEENTPPYTPVKVPVSLSTSDGHHGSVISTGNHWDLNIESPPGALSAMTFSLTTDPSVESASHIAAKVLYTSPERIQFQYSDKKQTSTSPLAPPVGKPCDIYELAPNGRAKCRTCQERIVKNSPRVGIQEWNARYKHWRPKYYHKDCCTSDVLQSLRLDKSGTRKRPFQKSIVASDKGSVEKKLKTELHRQDEDEMAKRCMVYGTRQELTEDLRRLRRELACQLEIEPYKVFNDETLDDLVAKLPATEMELIKCHGIAQRRCERYGGAILQVISQYTNEQVNVECSDKSSSSCQEDDYY